MLTDTAGLLLHVPLPGVSSPAWQGFVRALTVQGVGAVSDSGGFGCFDLRPRRLADLGIMSGIHAARTPSGRQVGTGAWVAPWTAGRFLGSLVAQYSALVRSLRLYDEAMRAGTLERPAGCSRAGALAILHRGGVSALRSFPNLFSDTRALYERAQGAF
jgi:hypothetical protein